jgi:hypothetical protein
MQESRRRVLATLALVVLALGVAALSVTGCGAFATPGAVTDTAAIADAQRDAGMRFAPSVSARDREWVLGSVAKARPEAQALIAEVDGLIEIQTHQGLPIGVTKIWQAGDEAKFVISLDTVLLNGRRVIDRDVVMLHELGHVVDKAIVPQDVNDKLDALIPRTGTCEQAEEGLVGSCTEPVERFADTFAKWALRGGVSAAGAGYGIASPPSLEDWGAPLSALAYGLAH